MVFLCVNIACKGMICVEDVVYSSMLTSALLSVCDVNLGHNFQTKIFNMTVILTDCYIDWLCIDWLFTDCVLTDCLLTDCWCLFIKVFIFSLDSVAVTTARSGTMGTVSASPRKTQSSSNISTVRLVEVRQKVLCTPFLYCLISMQLCVFWL